MNQKVASNRLKIEQQVAYGFVLIANRYGSARQNSYGLRAILRLQIRQPKSQSLGIY